MDISSSLKLNKDNTQATLTLPDVSLGQYKVLFDLTGIHDITLSSTIRVVD
jgi:hypothetical protein